MSTKRKRIAVTCGCGKVFETIPAYIRKGGGKFCSKACYWKYKRPVRVVQPDRSLYLPRTCAIYDCGEKIPYNQRLCKQHRAAGNAARKEAKKFGIKARKKCPLCGKQFWYTRKHIAGNPLRVTGRYRAKTCSHCGAEFVPAHSSQKHCIACIGDRYERKACSVACNARYRAWKRSSLWGRDAEVALLFKSGLNIAAIQRHFAVGRGSRMVSSILRRCGLWRTASRGTPPVAYLVSLYQKGLSTIQLAKQFDRSPQWINSQLRKGNCTLRKPGRAPSPDRKCAKCQRVAVRRRFLCRFHLAIREAQKQRMRNRVKKGIPPERWRVQDAAN